MTLSALRNLTGKFLHRPSYKRSVSERNQFGTLADQTILTDLLEPPTRDDIRQCYRLILGREPENDRIIDEQMQYPSVAAFRIAALKSVEFRGKYTAMCAEKSDPYWSSSRRTLVFIHMEKTGGTTLRKLLAAQFDEDRICPGPNNPIYSFPVAELGYYDFFSGHFDLDSVRYIPRQSITTISLFREPVSRLISWYRFHKAHPVSGEHAVNRLVVLANQLTAEEFFESPEVRVNQLAYNRYLFAFGRSFSWFDHKRESLTKSELDAVLSDAKGAIQKLTALGITERFDLSVRYIYKSLNLPHPAAVSSLNVTDEMPNLLPGFHPVEPVQMTPRLASSLDELTCYDQEIYRFAISEFERRCTESELS